MEPQKIVEIHSSSKYTVLVHHSLLFPAAMDPPMDNLTSRVPTIAPVDVFRYIQTRSESLKYLFLFFLLLTTAAGSLRLYVRSRLVRIFGADDIFLLATMVRASLLPFILSNIRNRHASPCTPYLDSLASVTASVVNLLKSTTTKHSPRRSNGGFSQNYSPFSPPPYCGSLHRSICVSLRRRMHSSGSLSSSGRGRSIAHVSSCCNCFNAH